MVETLEIGKRYRVSIGLALKRWCICNTTLLAGDIVKIVRQPSPNRVEVLVNGGLHKVRRSTLRMLVDLINDP